MADTTDKEIRVAMLRMLRGKSGDLDDKGLVIEELGICRGDARIDIAVINDAIHGYEIKSDRDTLKRLPRQIDIYGKVLDYITLVVAGRHMNKTIGLVPNWWGLSEAIVSEKGILIRRLRHHKKNPEVDPYSLVQLLWREELIQALEGLGIKKGIKGKSRTYLSEILVGQQPPTQLRKIVQEKLKLRGENWRNGEVHTS